MWTEHRAVLRQLHGKRSEMCAFVGASTKHDVGIYVFIKKKLDPRG
jgi:hypothetical protein